MQPAHPDAARDGLGGAPDALDLGAPEGDRRQRAGRVAGVDAGLLDVLHDAAEVELGAVEERVDVDLDRVVEEPVDQHRVLRADLRRARSDVARRSVVVVVDDLHAAAAEHVRRADQHRVADVVGDRRAPRSYVVAMPYLRRRQPGLGQHPAERAALLGQVDRLRAGADDRARRRP